MNVENATRIVDYRDRRTAVLWGDGSAAAVMILADGNVPARDVPGGAFFLGTVGYGLYAMFTLPALLVGVFLLERWTADRRQ